MATIKDITSKFTLTDKQLDALQDALRARSHEGEEYVAAYEVAAHMIHEARMAAHQERHEKLMTRVRSRREWRGV